LLGFDSVDELNSVEDVGEVLGAVQESPSLGGGLPPSVVEWRPRRPARLMPDDRTGVRMPWWPDVPAWVWVGLVIVALIVHLIDRFIDSRRGDSHDRAVYPIYDTERKPEVPNTPSGCVWYFIGFCIFAFLVFAFVNWAL
jgi:hypothetical protein